MDGLDFNNTLLKLLGSLNIASKEWVIRQYDHEVQGGSVVKPLVGVANDGPSDAAVLIPLESHEALVAAGGTDPNAAVLAGGQVIEGAMVSFTVMVWAQVAILPLASVAL